MHEAAAYARDRERLAELRPADPAHADQLLLRRLLLARSDALRAVPAQDAVRAAAGKVRFSVRASGSSSSSGGRGRSRGWRCHLEQPPVANRAVLTLVGLLRHAGGIVGRGGGPAGVAGPGPPRAPPGADAAGGRRPRKRRRPGRAAAIARRYGVSSGAAARLERVRLKPEWGQLTPLPQALVASRSAHSLLLCRDTTCVHTIWFGIFQLLE